MKEIIYYHTSNDKCPYLEWFNKLDNRFKVRIQKRLKKLCNEGYYGDYHALQNSKLSELRFDFGKGYRIYYLDVNNTLILFFGGSDKKDQKQVIIKCNGYYKDFTERIS